MIRTSVNLPAPLHQRVMLAAKAEKKNMVEMIRELLNQALAAQEKERIEKSYEALDKMIGIYKDDDPNLASSVDEILYGENGAWKGEHE